jgi:fructuronate reductase
MNRLNTSTLTTAAQHGATVPGYDRASLQPGVVHIGLGAFHRAHQAMVFDALLSSGSRQWGVFGVAMRSTQLADDLAQQDGLYAVQIASRDGIRWQVPGALLATCVLARDAQPVVDAIAAPSTRWVTLTVTEKGYTPELADLLVRGLALRRQNGLPGLTVASCDNLSNNGRRLQAQCEAAAVRFEAMGSASPASESFAAWITRACAFPNSMVDRIVPAATPARLAAAQEALGIDDACALGTEGFWEWAIEDNFAVPADAEALTSAGVTVVQDVLPFEEAKLRMLNGSHSAMACIGAVAGLKVICDCISEPAVRQFVCDLMTDEFAPHLTRSDWADYREALLARFANPELKHSVHQIATDNSQKIPQRWPLTVVLQMQRGASFEHIAFAAAAFMRYLQGVNELGDSYTLNDPMAATLQPIALAHAQDTAATVRTLSAFPEVWGDNLPHNAQWQARVAHWLGEIKTLGVLPAVSAFNVSYKQHSIQLNPTA